VSVATFCQDLKAICICSLETHMGLCSWKCFWPCIAKLCVQLNVDTTVEEIVTMMLEGFLFYIRCWIVGYSLTLTLYEYVIMCVFCRTTTQVNQS